jgi:membrane protein DedA with SNARE-associated domain
LSHPLALLCMIELLASHGSYLGIIGVLVLAGAGLPVPEELVVMVAAVTSQHGLLNPWLAWGACLVGAVAGDSVMYGIGYFFGRNLLRDRGWGSRWLTPAREQAMERLIARHGFKVFFLGRFLVGLRSPLYLTAGILRMPFQWFLLTDLSCALVVVTVFFGLGYIFAERIYGWLEWIQNAEMALTAMLVGAVGALALAWYWRRRKRWTRALMRRAEGRHRPRRQARRRKRAARTETPANGSGAIDDIRHSVPADRNGADHEPSSAPSDESLAG